MDERMKGNLRNRNYDEYDIKNKLKKHNESMEKMKDRFRKIQDKAVEAQKAENMLKYRKEIDSRPKKEWF